MPPHRLLCFSLYYVSLLITGDDVQVNEEDAHHKSATESHQQSRVSLSRPYLLHTNLLVTSFLEFNLPS